MTDPIIPATARNGEYSVGLSGMHEYKRQLSERCLLSWRWCPPSHRQL